MMMQELEYYALETEYSDVCVDWTGRDETE